MALTLPVVYFEANSGAGGPGAPGAPPPEPPVAPPAAPPPGPVGGPPPPAPPAGGQPTEAPADTIRRLETSLADARKEAAGYRTANKGQLAELHKALGGFLGIEAGQQQPTEPTQVVTALQERFSKLEQENRTSKVDLALSEVYTKHGVDPKLARAVLASEGVLAALDPGDGEFHKTVDAAVKKLAGDYPRLKVGPAPTPSKSGGEFPGGASAPPQLTREQLKGMSADQVNEAREKGQLDQVLGRS